MTGISQVWNINSSVAAKETVVQIELIVSGGR